MKHGALCGAAFIVMAAGLSRSQQSILSRIALFSQARPIAYKFSPYSPLEDVDIAIVDIDNQKVARRWKSIGETRVFPDTIYISKTSQFAHNYEMEVSVNSPFDQPLGRILDKPIDYSRLLVTLDQIVT